MAFLYSDDPYLNDTHGEDGPVTRDEMIESEMFDGETDEDEATAKRVNAMLSRAAFGMFLAFGLAALFWLPFLVDCDGKGGCR